MAFTPANLIPGIEASNDRVLQGRLFSYGDTQRYRLGGPNYELIPINCPYRVRNYNQDGFMRVDQNKSCFDKNYEPNSVGGPKPDPSVAIKKFEV